ncbi:MAG: hypothetical protein ABIG61_13305 [Planctomycetota bacterium]
MAKEGSGQKELFINPEEQKQKRLDKVFDRIKNKYGDAAVKRGGYYQSSFSSRFLGS